MRTPAAAIALALLLAPAALRRAIALRPEPGRNIPTYGTNIEARYYPYLHLAEACLALGQLEAAREALEKSASWGAREPADERQKLAARLELATAPRRPASPSPPPATAAPVAPPTSPPVVAEPTPTSPPVAVPSVPASPGAAPLVPRKPFHPGHVGDRETPPPPEASSGPVSVAPGARTAAGTLEIISLPPGATTYIDDEPVGATDPQAGRLVKRGLAPGRHHVRLKRAGYEDTVQDLDVSPGGAAVFRATLTPVSAVSAGARMGLVALAVLAIGVVIVLAWLALRRPEEAVRLGERTPRSRGHEADAATPSGISPGARSDEVGQEWFGEFRILEMLGKGGMASVFKVQRRGELSALKRPLGSLLEDPQFRERFLREAEIGRTLNHPNIVRILERGDVGRVPYFTMELLPGETLQSFIAREGAATPRLAVSIAVQVAEALDFAHSKGVVHRDLKPSNVMLLPDGTVKVMDFGIARARRFEGMTACSAAARSKPPPPLAIRAGTQ